MWETSLPVGLLAILASCADCKERKLIGCEGILLPLLVVLAVFLAAIWETSLPVGLLAFPILAICSVCKERKLIGCEGILLPLLVVLAESKECCFFICCADGK